MSNYIPEDCLPEILKWLPVKSLARFRCVCRGWNALICSSSFIARHLACSKSKSRLFIDSVYPKTSRRKSGVIFDSDSHAATSVPHIIPNRIPEPNHIYKVVGSAKGIICIHVHRNAANCGEKAEVVLWNPAIDKYIKLPESHIHSTFSYTSELIAFGVKPSEEDDLRVLRVACYPDSELAPAYACEIYSVGQGAWRVIHPNIASCEFSYDHLVKCCVNGAVYWVAVDNAGSYMLIRFGFEEEEFSCISLPDILADSHHSGLNVAVYCGRLALLQWNYCADSTHSRWKIWTKRSGNEDSWSVIICTDPLHECNFVYGITHDGQFLMSGSNYNDDCLVLYDSTSKSFRELDMQESYDRVSVCEFVESLVFMDGEGGALTLPPP